MIVAPPIEVDAISDDPDASWFCPQCQCVLECLNIVESVIGDSKDAERMVRAIEQRHSILENEALTRQSGHPESEQSESDVDADADADADTDADADADADAYTGTLYELRLGTEACEIADGESKCTRTPSRHRHGDKGGPLLGELYMMASTYDSDLDSDYSSARDSESSSGSDSDRASAIEAGRVPLTRKRTRETSD